MSKKKKSHSSKAVKTHTAVEEQVPDSFILLDDETENGLIRVVQATYQGLIPPASELANYNDILPGSADRILSMAEADAQHQREMEKLALTANISKFTRGQNYGLIITISAFVLTGILGAYDQIAVAAITGGSSVVSLA